MKKMLARAVKYVRSARAVSAIEYAILVGVVAVAIAAAITTFTGEINEALEAIGGAIDAPTVATPDADGGV